MLQCYEQKLQNNEKKFVLTQGQNEGFAKRCTDTGPRANTQIKVARVWRD
jgi:hypothetical protein